MFPKRWEQYSDIGTVVEGTPFIPFKVPLNDFISRSLPNEVAPFRPSDLLEHFMHHNLRVGIIIDLTNTTKYYSSKEFEFNDIYYVKIFTEGHKVPRESICKQFFDVVDQFLSSATNYNLIGIHCTHGVNRTGYLICRYMIDKLKMNPNECINAFSNARGHPIERENYINALLNESPINNYESIESYLKTEPLNDESPKKDVHQKSYQNKDHYFQYNRQKTSYNDRYNKFNNEHNRYNRFNKGNVSNNLYNNDNFQVGLCNDRLNGSYMIDNPYNKSCNGIYNRDGDYNYNSLNYGFKIGYDNIFNSSDYFKSHNNRSLNNNTNFNFNYNRESWSKNISYDKFKHNKDNRIKIFQGNNLKLTQSNGEICSNSYNKDIEKKLSNCVDNNDTKDIVIKLESKDIVKNLTLDRDLIFSDYQITKNSENYDSAITKDNDDFLKNEINVAPKIETEISPFVNNSDNNVSYCDLHIFNKNANENNVTSDNCMNKLESNTY